MSSIICFSQNYGKKGYSFFHIESNTWQQWVVVILHLSRGCWHRHDKNSNTIVGKFPIQFISHKLKNIVFLLYGNEIKTINSFFFAQVITIKPRCYQVVARMYQHAVLMPKLNWLQFLSPVRYRSSFHFCFNPFKQSTSSKNWWLTCNHLNKQGVEG